MTLIIALVCKEGIVMASDGQSTRWSAGGPPIRISSQKIFPIGSRMLFAASGTVGIIQQAKRVMNAFEQEVDKGFSYELVDKIRQNLFGVFQQELQRHKTFWKGTEYEKVEHAPTADILLAYCECKAGRPSTELVHITRDAFYESLTDQGFAATGIGDVFAYTILGNYYRKDINISRGIILAYRVIKTAIETGAWGLGEPIDIWILTCNGPKQIKGPELDAVRDAYGAWMEAERSIFYETTSSQSR